MVGDSAASFLLFTKSSCKVRLINTCKVYRQITDSWDTSCPKKKSRKKLVSRFLLKDHSVSLPGHFKARNSLLQYWQRLPKALGHILGKLALAALSAAPMAGWGWPNSRVKKLPTVCQIAHGCGNSRY